MKEIDSKTQAVVSGLSWMLEMGFIESPSVQQALVQNLKGISSSVRTVEFLSDSQARKMLVYLRLTWWGRYFRKTRILATALAILNSGLPSYRFRVVVERSIFDRALVQAEKLIAYRKLTSEKPINSQS